MPLPPSQLVRLRCDSKSVWCFSEMLIALANQNQSKETERKFNAPFVTTELYHRPKLAKKMIARHLDAFKEDWTGELLSKKYHLTFM